MNYFFIKSNISFVFFIIIGCNQIKIENNSNKNSFILTNTNQFTFIGDNGEAYF